MSAIRQAGRRRQSRRLFLEVWQRAVGTRQQEGAIRLILFCFR